MQCYQLPGEIPRMGLGMRQARILAQKFSDFQNSCFLKIMNSVLEAFCFRNSEGFGGSEEHALTFSSILSNVEEKYEYTYFDLRSIHHIIYRTRVNNVIGLKVL